jgi:hypothetical protein
MRPRTTQHDETRSARWRSAAFVVGALALLAAAGTVVGTVVQRAEARFEATTVNEGSLLAAGTVEVEVGPLAADGSRTGGANLALDVANMVPSTGAERCITAVYVGDLDDVTIDLVARRQGPAGLDRFLDVTITRGRGEDPTCGDFAGDEVVFAGTLEELFEEHADAGVELLAGASNHDSVTARIEFDLADADEAQGLELWYWMTIEARA